MKREFERRYETAAEVGKRCAEARHRGEQVWLGRRFVLFEITPATIAKRRLQDVIAADRAHVPCGRWVKVLRFSWAEKMELWSLQNGAMVYEAPAYPVPPLTPQKPRYRLSERR